LVERDLTFPCARCGSRPQRASRATVRRLYFLPPRKGRVREAGLRREVKEQKGRETDPETKRKWRNGLGTKKRAGKNGFAPEGTPGLTPSLLIAAPWG